MGIHACALILVCICIGLCYVMLCYVCVCEFACTSCWILEAHLKIICLDGGNGNGLFLMDEQEIHWGAGLSFYKFSVLLSLYGFIVFPLFNFFF